MGAQVVFSEAYWIGTKAENPEEHKLPMPLSLIEAGKKAQGAAPSSQTSVLARPGQSIPRIVQLQKETEGITRSPAPLSGTSPKDVA